VFSYVSCAWQARLLGGVLYAACASRGVADACNRFCSEVGSGLLVMLSKHHAGAAPAAVAHGLHECWGDVNKACGHDPVKPA
jgi:hypothetical protein